MRRGFCDGGRPTAIDEGPLPALSRLSLRHRELLLWVDLRRLAVVGRTTGVVKGFRMPASHCARGCMEAGVRKASKEETAGEYAPAAVSVYGDLRRGFCATWP